MDFVTIEAIRQMVVELREWEDFSNITFNVFFMDQELRMPREFTTLEMYSKALINFCESVLTCKTWFEMQKAMHCPKDEAERIKHYVDVIIKYHQILCDKRYSPGGEGYQRAKEHFEESTSSFC